MTDRTSRIRALVWRSTLGILLLVNLWLIPPWSLNLIRYDSLDGAWIALYNELAFSGRKLQFGRDHVFTMGPLASLRMPFYFPGNTVPHLLWGGLLALCSTLAYARLFGRAPLWAKIIGAVVVVALPLLTFNRATKLLTSMKVLFVYGAAVQERESRFSWWDLCFTVLAAVSALVIFTELITSVIAVAFVAAIHFARNHRVSAVPWVFLGLVVAGWALLGQSLSNFPLYIWRSLAISTGYGEAMARWSSWWEPVGAVAALGILLFFLVCQVRRKPLLTALLVLATVALFYVSFKHSFVRHQRPRITLVGVTLVGVSLGYLGFVGTTGQGRRRLAALVPLAASLVVAGSFLGGEPFGPGAWRAAKRWPRNQTGGFRMLVERPEQLPRRHADELLRVREAVPLPPLEGSLDWFGFSQGIALAHGLNLQPRPVFQNFAAFSPSLAELNGTYYAGPKAPRWVIAEIGGFGGFLPSTMDSHAFLELFQRYVIRERIGALVLMEQSPTPRPFSRRLVVDRQLQVDQEVPLDRYAEQPLWAEITLRPSSVGRLSSLLFKPLPLKIQLRFTDGNEHTASFSATSAAAGFLLSPVIRNHGDFVAFSKDRWRPRLPTVDSFRVFAAFGPPALSPREGHLRIYQLARD